MNREARGRVFRALTGAGVILIASLGTVLAANIVIGNANQPREFGQGVYQIKACDSWIQLNLVSGATGQFGAPSGFSALTGISIQGLDASQCISTQFVIRAVDGAANILPIYRTDRKVQMCTVKPICVIGKSAESDLVISISSKADVALSGADSFHGMTYSSSTGIYTISFTQPGQLAVDISDLTIQSAAI